jgi:hypothetical protein
VWALRYKRTGLPALQTQHQVNATTHSTNRSKSSIIQITTCQDFSLIMMSPFDSTSTCNTLEVVDALNGTIKDPNKSPSSESIEAELTNMVEEHEDSEHREASGHEERAQVTMGA